MTQPRGPREFNLGDVVTLVYPLVGGSMPRPALVLADTGDDDIVVARITTHLSPGILSMFALMTGGRLI